MRIVAGLRVADSEEKLCRPWWVSLVEYARES